MPLLCCAAVFCTILVRQSKNNEQTVSLSKAVHCKLVQDDGVSCNAGWWSDEMHHWVLWFHIFVVIVFCGVKWAWWWPCEAIIEIPWHWVCHCNKNILWLLWKHDLGKRYRTFHLSRVWCYSNRILHFGFVINFTQWWESSPRGIVTGLPLLDVMPNFQLAQVVMSVSSIYTILENTVATYVHRVIHCCHYS